LIWICANAVVQQNATKLSKNKILVFISIDW
jgi:hypothetical protein